MVSGGERGGGRPQPVGKRSVRRLIAVFVLVATVPLIVLVYATATLSARAVTQQARSMVEVATELEAGAVTGVLASFVNLSQMVATRSSIVANLEPAGGGPADADAIQGQMDSLIQSDPQLIFAGVFDRAGRVIAGSPAALAQRGADFSYRDWYRGARRAGAPYVSPAFLSTAGELTVGVPAPIRTPAGAAAPAPVIGYVYLGYRVDTIRSQILRLAAGQRVSVTVTDQAGVVIAAPDQPAGLIPATGDQRVRRALAGESGTMFMEGPHGRVLSGYAPVRSTGWTVHADLPERLVLARVRSLRSTVLVIGTVLGCILTVALVLLARAWRQRAASQEAEHRSAVHARNLLETSLDPMVTIAPDGKVTDLNEATVQATGVPRDRLLGSDFTDYFTDFDQASAAYRQAFEHGQIVDYPLALRHTSGRVTDVLYNATVYRQDDGQVVGVFAAARDVTERNRAEKTVREQADRLDAMVATTRDGFCRFGADGHLLQVSDGYAQMSGYSRDELLAMHITDLDPQEDSRQVTARIAAVARVGFDRFESRHRRKDGSLFDVEISVSSRGGAEFLAFVRDITAWKRSQAELHALNTELEHRVHERTADLERANENLRSFTYSVSHDLRAPLLGLTGFTHLLLDEYGDRLDGTGRDYAQRIQVAAERMGRLIDDLLQLSRVGRADVHLEPVDLSAEAESVAEELRRCGLDRDVHVTIEPAVLAVADRRLIRTVIENLMGNAWKFTARREFATIEFGTVPTDNGEVCCYVRDNGAGFDPAYADHLFQPFQRLHSVKEYPGTGIGLASVRRVIERHHGRVWAQGAVGNGATFYFTLDAKERS